MRGLFRLPGGMVRDSAVTNWFKSGPPSLCALAQRWFEIIRGCGDDVRELLHDGHPTACVGDAAFAYVNVFTAHVNVGFFHCAELDDAPALAALIEAAYADLRRGLEAEAPRVMNSKIRR